ncbi:MAG: glucose-6-phosphate isomerase [Firmicutes bacterium]|nr:glucose-6-phosphate isomerase [Bacillota bacterium]
MDINVNIEGLDLEQSEIEALRPEAAAALDKLWSGEMDMTGWVKAPIEQDEEELKYLLDVADIVRLEAELMVVLGIGGSYMGAKAAIEALPKQEHGIEVKFLGINFCTDYYREIIEDVKRKNTILCVISKSGNTMEIQAALEVLRPIMEQKYGSKEEAAKRIIAVTDEKSGRLREEVNEMGYTNFPVPGNIGGRYSMMTPAGLLPIAVSGIDVRELLRGAAAAATSPLWDTTGTDYAIGRYIMHEKKGKAVDVTCFNHSRLAYFGEWMKQLFGESEGKEGKGLWPATLQFSTDLHSMGQFLQEGSRIFLETMLIIDGCQDEIVIPAGTFKGMTIEEMNDIMVEGVIKAHRSAGNPLIEIHVPELTPYYFGQLVYFMETSCAITGILMGVNPFDQPGVEQYKAEMRKLCGLDGK